MRYCILKLFKFALSLSSLVVFILDFTYFALKILYFLFVLYLKRFLICVILVKPLVFSRSVPIGSKYLESC
jgi:hypothetical protein